VKTIILTLSAAKDLDALPRDAREQVEAGLHRYAMTGQGDVKALQGRDGYRLRIGSYRVIFDEDATTILSTSAAGPRRLTRGAKVMSAPQIIRTPGGEELVVLPRAEYEALLKRADHEAEDADDVAIYDARKAELAAGGVVLPPEVSTAILRGESRLKAIRNWRGETQLHLNFITGIGQGYLSDLESGRRTGTPETIAKLAQALNVPVEWLS
jgi:mRNA-degrading endonuclease RelE of RelBE toxin-antitoxin system/PHD/YefM family antitoxin component YafN of YafNO toxin-antitoxin module